MQEVIRDGALRLMTSEATCDVILNCQGRRLMAHKIMLSIASPLLQDLLVSDTSDMSVLVLPDINATIMAYILDYIYTGSVMLHSSMLSEFFSIANLLSLKIEQNVTPSSTLLIETNQRQNQTPQNYSKKLYSSTKLSNNYESNSIYSSKTLINCEEFKSATVSECGPNCYKMSGSVMFAPPIIKTNITDDKLCDFKITEKRLKFTPIILQDERNPGLINGNRFRDEKLKLNSDNLPSYKSIEISNSVTTTQSTTPTVPINNNNSNNIDSISNNCVARKKTTRKVPNLMPISRSQFSAFKTRRGLYNRVFPSPWCPRIIPVTGDPRNDCLRPQLSSTVSNGSYYMVDTSKENLDSSEEQNDKNNNLKRSTYQPLNVISNVASTERNISPGYNNKNHSESVALNLNITYEKDKLINNASDYSKEISLPIIDNKLKNYETIISEKNPSVFENRSSVVLTTELKENTSVIVNHSSEFQNVSSGYQPRTSDSTYSSAESSNSSCGDAKSGEDCVKISDEDGKEDGDIDRRQKRYECEDCGKQFSQLRNYKYHRSVHEGTKEFAARCPECGKVFNDRGYLSSHLKIHRDRKEYGCPHCPKRFNQRVAYNMHLRIHTGVKPHVCPTCGKGFSRKMLLKQHQRVHTGERPYQCPECGKSFADRSNMSLHARLHTGVKPYACSLCPKSFTKKHHLKTHMNYHTGLKPYVCQKCGLTFSQSSNMRTHYKKCIQKDSTDVTSTIPPSSSS